MHETERSVKLVIVGGSVAGITAAKRARRLDEKLDITIIDESKYLCYPLPAIPIFSSGRIKKLEAIYSNDESAFIDVYNIKLLSNHKALEIDRENKIVSVRNLSSEKKFEISYDNLILATGSAFKLPKITLKKINNVFTLNNLEESIKIREFIEKTSAREIIIVGYCHHALITANSFIKDGFEVTIIDKKSFDINEFDPEFRFLIKDELVKSGVKFYSNTVIKKYIKTAKETASSIELSNGMTIKSQIIIFFDNYSANTELAEKSNLDMGITGRIKVNEFFQTNKDDNIYAIGSIAETFNKITSKPYFSKLAIPVQIQGRIAGSSTANKKLPYPGCLGTCILKIQNLVFGSTGLTLRNAQKNEINAFSVTLFIGEKERYTHDNEKLHLKITINRDDKKIIGAQVCGSGTSVDKVLDILVTAISLECHINDLASFEFSYSPELSLQRNQINTLGMIAANMLDKISISKGFEELLFNNNICFLDVRNKHEYEKAHIDGALWIPLNELRARIDEVPKDIDIYIYGHIGLRGYVAERILKGNGFLNVYNIEGGITTIKLLEKMG